MTVAPGALASTAANTRTEAGRSSAPAVLRATTMSREILLRKDFTGRFTDRASRRPVTPQGRDRRFRAVVWRPGLPSAGTAGSDSGKATTPSRVMRRGPFHHHHQPARLPNRLRPSTPLILPSGDSWYLPRPWPTGATRARSSPRPCVATGCTATSPKNLRRTANCLARERAMGNEVAKNRSMISNLTLRNTREPFGVPRPS